MSTVGYTRTKLSDTLKLSETPNGFFLWDDAQKINLAMRAKSEREALVYALTYANERLSEVEAELRTLKTAVAAFAASVGYVEGEQA